MFNRTLVVTTVIAASLLTESEARAQPAGIREACRIFVERSNNAPARPDWGDSWNWTVVDNKDGTFSVGAKYRYESNGRLRGGYTTCVIKESGKDFQLVKLTHLL